MTERGMIFNADMVRAILDGRKTQTRREVKLNLDIASLATTYDWATSLAANHYQGLTEEQIQQKAESLRGVIHPVILGNGQMVSIICPHGKPGDRIWVREAFRVHSRATDVATLVYKASERNSWTEQTHRVPVAVCNKPATPEKWTPSLHMPRWASRILLEITGVRVERLRSMSQDDARAEGVIAASGPMEAGLAFRELWDSIYGEESWKANPWVWVISFERVEGGAA
ncbi:hypothetical protein ACUB3A_002277 [Klebsiella pneumoniae]|uniref:hypothetical protein n=1 Tax=Klebsiella pneumoniae complex TaxID=3390273 RepID=UPI000E2DF425|nr:hypothetical protein [Klebsiella variicola]HBQ2301101.1 hypothetical protein [Klebsiella pneumoniae]MBR7366113.1 hypothetical protein [Klebsiella variicola]SXE69491.1 morphogenetic protein [Klebsiella variicola]HDK6466454.1 hypothetical protein [Klebsiella variicola]HEF8915094.1 hypothetical protein [Klebsiella pneumoniae]